MTGNPINAPQPLNIDAILKSVNLSARPTRFITAIEKNRNSKVISIVYNELAGVSLTPAMINPLEAVLERIGKVERLDLFLRSTGGMAEIPWRVVSLLREFTDHLGIIVSGMALSGGTHIAISGDDLIMTPFSTLGPVDPTKQHPLLPKDLNNAPIPTSVQDLKDLVEFLKQQLGESFQDSTVITELFKYINPLAIGSLEQGYNLSRLITDKVLSARKDPLSTEEIAKIRDALAGKYYSHGFYISRADVEKDLGLPVLKPDEELTKMIKRLQLYYKSQFDKQFSDPTQPGVGARIAAFIQSKEEAWVIAQVFASNEFVIDPWIKAY
jgi:hypothetical protein